MNMNSLPQFQTESTDAAKQSYSIESARATEETPNYSISLDYEKSFDLIKFLKVVWTESPETEKIGHKIEINNDEQLINFLVRHLKSKKYIGVGVGGIFIPTVTIREPEDEYVLLYKRYHEPEKQVWSIPGGSSQIYENIETTLSKKISRLTGISQGSIEVKDIIIANNHHEEENQFHYLSPAFYVNIKNLNRYLFWGNQANDAAGKKRNVSIIDAVSDFKIIEESTYEKPKLAWVKVSIIKDDCLDENGTPLFSYTTLEAIERHERIRNASKRISAAAKEVESYTDWRLKSV